MAESPRVVSVYALLDERRQVRYIGQSENPKRRSGNHWYGREREDHRRKNPALTSWLRSLDRPPAFHVLETVDWKDRYAAEGYWTDLLRQVLGQQLLNVASGKGVSRGTRRKMSDARAGKPSPSLGKRFSPESRARMSAAHLGKKRAPFSDAHRQNISAARKGKKPSPETLAKLSAVRRGRVQEQQWCEECQRSWTPNSWPRHVRKYHEGGKW